ncbi:MAG: hypothetical protein FJW31_17765 [Acidobacteria bacterium]|nr:hypothetical protein [Acidobacteriota bacterium]
MSTKILHQSPLVLPYAPMPRPATKSKPASATSAEPPKPAPLSKHPGWFQFVTQLGRSLLHPHPHLKPAIYGLLEYADTL